MQFAYSKWKERALVLISKDLENVQLAQASLHSTQSLQELVRVASSELGLAKNLDSFRFDFAGPSYEKALNDAVDASVHAAYDLLSSIGISNDQ